MGVVQRRHGPFWGVVDAPSPSLTEWRLDNAPNVVLNFRAALKRSGPARSLPAPPSNLIAPAFVPSWGRPGCWNPRQRCGDSRQVAARAAVRGRRAVGGVGTGAVCGML